MKLRDSFIIFCIAIILLIFTGCDTRGKGEASGTLSLEAIPDSMFIDNGDTGCEIIATLLDSNGYPMPNKDVCFDIKYDITLQDAFIFGDECVITDENGTAKTWVWDKIEVPLGFSFIAEVEASWGDIVGNVQIRVLPLNEKK